MPTPIIEPAWDTGNGSESEDSGSKDLVYLVTHVDNEDQAVQMALLESPIALSLPTGRGIIRQNIEWEVDDAEIYRITVNYGPQKKLTQGGYEVAFDTTGGNEKRTQSIFTRAGYAPPGKTAPNFHGAIGVNKDSVEGVDLPSSTFKWTETHKLPRAFYTWSYALTLRACTNKVLAAPFRVFGAEEVLFRGAQGSIVDEENAQIVFTFEAGEHANNLTVGAITGIAKKAWDYVWVRYADTEDANQLIKRPVAAYVEIVFFPIDPSLLGIGTNAGSL